MPEAKTVCGTHFVRSSAVPPKLSTKVQDQGVPSAFTGLRPHESKAPAGTRRTRLWALPTTARSFCGLSSSGTSAWYLPRRTRTLATFFQRLPSLRWMTTLPALKRTLPFRCTRSPSRVGLSRTSGRRASAGRVGTTVHTPQTRAASSTVTNRTLMLASEVPMHLPC